MFYVVLLTPLLLAIISFMLNKKYWKLLSKITIITYFILSCIIISLFITKYNFKNNIFYTNYSLDFNNFTSINTLFILLIIILAFLISYYAYYYFQKEIKHKVIWYEKLKEYNIFVNLFVFAMLLVASTSNILIMWIWLEATTIFTTFLISFYNTKTSREAGWKYVILCSVWLTLWLFGIISLIVWWLESLNYLNIHTININILLVKTAFVFVLIGFWTKVGLFPMNSWLPDAHGKASTPVSAFMSSILLPLALYLIFRIKIIVDTMLWTTSFTNTVLLSFGVITLLYSWFIMLNQKHFKRMLAYSSTENMWIITIALWIFSPLSLKFWILHLIAHSFLKSASFMSVWNVLLEQKTWKFDNISNILKNQKITAILMILSLTMLVWIPISPLFISEIWIIYTLFEKNILLSILLIFSLILVFVWFIVNFGKLFDNKKNDNTKFIKEKFTINSIFLPITLTLILGIVSIVSILFIF